MTRAVSDDGPGARGYAKVAARLAGTTPVRELEPLFAELPENLRAPGVEMRACLLGELALIGARTGRERMDAYAGRLRGLGHPLARLPETRLDVEHRFGVRVRGLGSVKTLRQLLCRFPELPRSDAGAAAGRGAVGVDDDVRARAVARLFTAGGWARTPEVRFFALPAPRDPGDFGMSFLERLSLACLQGGGTAVACATTPDDVLNELFSPPVTAGSVGRGRAVRMRGSSRGRVCTPSWGYPPTYRSSTPCEQPPITGGCASSLPPRGSTTTPPTSGSPC